MIFLSLLLIPIIIIIFSFIFLKGITFKEFMLLLGISTAISFLFIGITYFSSTTFTETFNTYVSNKYNEKVSCRHDYCCSYGTCCSGSGKDRSCYTCCKSTCYEHSYDIDWTIESNIGLSFDIDTQDKQGLIEPLFWTNAKLGDGISFTRSYTNYIKGSSGSLFLNESLIDKYKNLLPEYPQRIYDYYNLRHIINMNSNLIVNEDTQKFLSKKNGQIGSRKQVNLIMILLPEVNEDYIYALDSYWKGGNKNDVILVISTDGHTIFWTNSLDLSQSSILKVNLRDSFIDNPIFDIQTAIDLFVYNVNEYYVRKPMKDFDYLKYSIVPSFTSFIISLILELISCFGLIYFFNKEDIA